MLASRAPHLQPPADAHSGSRPLKDLVVMCLFSNWETWIEVLTPGFSLAQPGFWDILRVNEQKGGLCFSAFQIVELKA